jgi:hypothetical protein
VKTIGAQGDEAFRLWIAFWLPTNSAPQRRRACASIDAKILPGNRSSQELNAELGEVLKLDSDFFDAKRSSFLSKSS